MLTDLTWLSQEARGVHHTIELCFWALLTFLLILGVVLEMFKMSLGQLPSLGTLVARVLIAVILLQSYPMVSNQIADVSDALSTQVGHLNQFDAIREKLGKKFSEMTLSWLSVKESITMIVCYVIFVLFHLSYYIAEAFLLYAWTLLYVFSPILIALYVIPATASATGALYRSLIEVSLWKPVWSVIATLLWSLPLSDINKGAADVNFLSVLSIVVLLAASLLMTPYIVHALAGAGLSSLSPGLGQIGMGSLAFGPGKILNRATQYGGAVVERGKWAYNAGHTAANHVSERYFAIPGVKKLPRFNLKEKKRPPLFEEKRK
ncbi:MAG: hypothetical protein HYZ71_06860 [Deltaproteobacteria bacterium]|nr:hypothetical protein [Deltaproteobacteria bacterium]